MLLNNKSIAKISSKPGKTLLINHFRVNDKLFIVDLPGYGYATVSKKIKEDIKNIHENYFKLRKELLYTLLLIDIRHDIQKKDVEFIDFMKWYLKVLKNQLKAISSNIINYLNATVNQQIL